MSWEMFDKFPPPLVRCLARRKVAGSHIVALSDQEIAMSADLSLDKIKEISQSLTWDDITIEEAQKFCSACNFDVFNSLDRNRAGAYLRKGAKFLYLRTSPYWVDTFLPLIKLMRKSGVNA